MSNHHPPQPPYGATYSSNTQVASSIAASYPGMQQYHHQPQGYSPYWQGQSLSNGMMLAQSTNGYAHHTNAKGANPPAFSAGAIQAPYGGYANAAQFSTIPPHLQTTVSNSAYVAAPYAPQQLVNSYHPALHEAAANNLPISQHSSAAPDMNAEGTIVANNSHPELEDGELSSGELSNSVDDLYADTAAMHDRPPPELTRSYALEMENMSRRDSIDSAENNTSRPSDKSAKVPTVEAPPKVTLSAREQAQAILRELHLYEIGFQDLADEGLEADVLRSLYAEMGLPLLSKGEQKKQNSEVQAPNPVKSSTLTQNSNIRESQGSSSNSVFGPDVASNDPGTNDLMETSVTSNPISNANANADSPKNPGSMKELRVSSLGKTATKITTAKPVDRKEYIARLMAAKSGKPLTNLDAESTPHQASSDAKMSASDATIVPPNDAKVITPSIVKDSMAPSTHSSQVQEETPDIEAKRKAQTELARQKIEALRNQKKSQGQEVIPTTSEAPEIYSGSAVVEVPTSTALSSAEVQRLTQMPLSTEHRQGSYFSPVSLKPAFSIPGLFTSSQAPNLQTNTKLPNAASAAKVSQSLPCADAADITVENSEGPRKRHKAADFMDSPSTTLQKLLSHGEETGVIIDISDDDTEDDSEDRLGHQSLRTDEFRCGNAPNSGFRSENDEKHNVDKLSPPPGVLATRVSTRELANSTPSVSNTPNKTQEPQELKTKEIAIETMNRKILELEQRIKAKQTASRAQSPRVPAASTSIDGAANRQSPSAAPQRVDTATEEQLLREKEKQQDKLATAEAEQVQMAKSEQRKAAPEHRTHEKPIKPIESEGLRQGPDKGQSIVPAQPGSETSIEAARHRMALLEAEISALEVDMTNSQEMYQQSKLELERIENDMQNKADRKRTLQQELIDLSSADQKTPKIQRQQPPPPPFGVDAQLQRGAVIESTNDNGISDVNGSPEHHTIPPKLADLPPTGLITFDSETQEARLKSKNHEATVEATDDPKLADALRAKNTRINEQLGDLDQLSEGELAEDNMDISGSDVDEGHVLETRPELVSKSEDVMDVADDEDIYEPPSHMGSTQQSANSVVDDQGQSVNHRHQHSSLEITATVPSGIQVEQAMIEATADASFPPKVDVGYALDDSSSQPVTREEDDYEPPEPETFMKGNTPPPNDIPTAGSAEKQPGETDNQSEEVILKTRPESGHFVPYESPLKQFASYRFHPDYRKQVPGGYRSLTYSHDIRPEVPICQSELGGGMCNDNSCTSQHFQQMALPDHLILGAMGKGEGSTADEKEAYIDGLRSLIFDLRKREIKDLNAIAEAISNYRLKFLDDASKVPPL